MLRHHLINFGLAVLVLTIFALTPKGQDLLGSRFFGIVDTINGEYERRLLENQIKTKDWMQVRFDFSSAAVAKMQEYGITGGKREQTRLNEISSGLIVGGENPLRVISPGGDYGSNYFDYVGSGNRHLAIRFKVKRPEEATGQTYIGVRFWGGGSSEGGTGYELRFSAFGKRDLNRVIYFSGESIPASKTATLPFSEEPDENEARTNLLGYYDVEIITADAYRSAIFINGNFVMENTKAQGGSPSIGGLDILFHGTNAVYTMKDLNIAHLTIETEE